MAKYLAEFQTPDKGGGAYCWCKGTDELYFLTVSLLWLLVDVKGDSQPRWLRLSASISPQPLRLISRSHETSVPITEEQAESKPSRVIYEHRQNTSLYFHLNSPILRINHTFKTGERLFVCCYTSLWLIRMNAALVKALNVALWCVRHSWFTFILIRWACPTCDASTRWKVSSKSHNTDAVRRRVKLRHTKNKTI